MVHIIIYASKTYFLLFHEFEQVFVSPKLAGITLVVVPTVAAMSIVYGRFLRKITKEYQDSLAVATSVRVKFHLNV